MEQVPKRDIYGTSGKFVPSTSRTPAISPRHHPHAFIDAPGGFGPFDIEIDCIAAVETK